VIGKLKGGQAWRKIRAILSAASPADVMPYFTKVRNARNCDRGILRIVCGPGAADIDGVPVGAWRCHRVTGPHVSGKPDATDAKRSREHGRMEPQAARQS
jgi:hypothetical protein